MPDAASRVTCFKTPSPKHPIPVAHGQAYRRREKELRDAPRRRVAERHERFALPPELEHHRIDGVFLVDDGETEFIAVVRFGQGVAVAAQAVEGAGGEEDARGAGADGGGADYAVDDGGDDGDSAADEGDYEGGLGGGSGGDGEGGVVGSSVVGWGSQ